MDIRFDALNIDNNAIEIVVEQLVPFLKNSADSRFRILDGAGITEKHIILYEEIFLPYCEERSNHFDYHHNDFASDTWCGEQVCLSKIHLINQKAWWLLHYFAIEEAIESFCDVKEEKLNKISRHIARCLLDGDMCVKDAVKGCISDELKLKESTVDSIVDKINTRLEEYKKVPSHPMTYR